MKKAYVKVKDKSAKSILTRPYIAATIIGASVCAIALSYVVKPEESKQGNDQTLSAQVAETQNGAESETAPPTASPKPLEIPNPAPQEITMPDSVPNEVATATEDAESVSVGLFGGTKKIVLKKPIEATIIKAYSGDKPVKSKTMGDWRMHTGVDFAAAQGAEICAAADGKVLSAKEDSLTGHTIQIDHGNGVISTVYNLENTARVTEGQSVAAGDVIGTAGNSARIEILDEPHVHFAVTVNGEYVNPEEYFQ